MLVSAQTNVQIDNIWYNLTSPDTIQAEVIYIGDYAFYECCGCMLTIPVDYFEPFIVEVD
ncbi:MAG: hypothetical protein IKY31_03755 [Bacteroidaceae bacterium]|nr:hypothetical protein [Bacteroidaceae bacterium]